VIGSLIGGAAGLAYTLDQSVKASGLDLHAPSFPWSHNGMFSSLDHARYSLYKVICGLNFF
jgi:ubiquinol-cytochrome c reductase cytochrome c1 subunit